MFNASRLRHDFDTAAARYDAHAALQQHVLTELIQKLGDIPATALVLDVGCGTGAFSRATNHSHVIGLDNAYAMCRAASETGALPLSADMATLPLADESVDILFSSLALQWADDTGATLREWQRVLKPSGILAFSSFTTGTLHELAESFGNVDSHQHISPFISLNELARDCSAAFATECVTEYYPNVAALARHLKALGARNKHEQQRHTLMTPRQFQRVEQYYSEHFGNERGLPVSWNIVYGILRKT